MSERTNAPLDGSQTESESDEEIVLPADYSTPYGSQNNTTPPAPPLVKDNANELVHAAARFLENISDEEAIDREAHEFVAEAVDYILAFVDALLVRMLIPKAHSKCIVELLSPSFMACLFRLRAIFRELAAKEITASGSNVTIVSWADELLVKLCACILHLATEGAMQDTNKVSGIPSIKTMQENETKRSAAQLPATLSQLSDTLLSKDVSPATSRMALTLLYGTYVLREQYQEVQCMDTSSEMNNLSASTSKYLAKHATRETSPVAIYPSVLAEYGMTVSLYIHCYIPNTSNPLEAPFTPHNEHVLVNLVDFILDHSSYPSAPTARSLGPLKLILNDSGVMRWFWKRWGDGSTTIASTALRLTYNWIQTPESHAGECTPTQFDVLWAAAPCSFQALLHVVGAPGIDGFPDPSTLPCEIMMVRQVCHAYILLTRNRTPGDLRYDGILAEACKRLCPYILFSDESDQMEGLRDLIIEFSIAVGPEVLRAAYGDAAVVQFRWNNRGLIEQVIQMIVGMINDTQDVPQVGSQPSSTPNARKLKRLLDFLVIFLHANTCAASAVISSATFMTTLIAWGSKKLTSEAALRTSTLMILGFAFSHFRVCCSVLTNRFPEFDLDGFIDAVLTNEASSLLETCALARYMIATEEDRMLDDPATVLEIWSRIQSALLSTLQHRFVGAEEAMYVAVSGTLCASLLSILNSAGKQTRAMILASPWTQTLRMELQRVVKNTSSDNYSLGLCRQLKDVGMAVVHVVENDSKAPTVEDSVRIVCVDAGGGLQIVPMLF